MPHYIEARRKDDRPILGNLDGQTPIRSMNWRSNQTYRSLKNTGLLHGYYRPRAEVAYWVVVSEQGHELSERIPNIYHPEYV